MCRLLKRSATLVERMAGWPLTSPSIEDFSVIDARWQCKYNCFRT